MIVFTFLGNESIQEAVDRNTINQPCCVIVIKSAHFQKQCSCVKRTFCVCSFDTVDITTVLLSAIYGNNILTTLRVVGAFNLH